MFLHKNYYIYFILAGQRFDAGNFSSLRVFAPSGSDIELCVVLELVGCVEEAAAVVRSHHSVRSVLCIKDTINNEAFDNTSRRIY